MENYSLPVGFRLNNKYRIQNVLGQGGFGITYLAEDTVLDIKVCIKELFVMGSSTRGANMTVLTQNMKEFSFADFRERFIQEAKQLARFNHPNIVRVIEFFEANNTAYVVMEYVEGPTLKEQVMAVGPLSAQVSQKIIESILDAVEVIHNASMLHRDIKPDNLIIGNDGRVVLIDFGSARAYSDEKTVAQTAMVSPGYAPLEQYNPNARKGAYTDIYSIGATFYYMLTGQKPLNVTERYTERMKAPHEINKNVSMQVSSAVMLAMEMKPEDRFQNIQDFRIALSMLSAPNPILEKPKTSDVQQPPKPKAVNKKSSGSSVLGGCLIAFLIISLLGIIVTFVIIFALSAAMDGSGSTQQGSSYEQETSISEPDQEKITNTSQEEPSYEDLKKEEEKETANLSGGGIIYTGTIGSKVVFELNDVDKQINGFYYYSSLVLNNVPSNARLTLREVSRNGNEITLQEYNPEGRQTGTHVLRFFDSSSSSISGRFIKYDGVEFKIRLKRY